jgi:hypothetical protein
MLLSGISLPEYVDDNRGMDANRHKRTSQVHEHAPATGLLDTGDTVSAEWKEQRDCRSQSWVVLSRDNRLYDVNRAIQDDQLHRNQPEANADGCSQDQREPDGSPYSRHIDHEDS